MKFPLRSLPAILVSKRGLLLGLLLAAGAGAGLFAQSRQDLERQRRQKEREINQMRHRLEATRNERRETLEYLEDLNLQINQRQNYIHTLQGQLGLLGRRISQQSDITAALERDLDALKREYARLLYYMYKKRSKQSTLGFVLSTESFNEALKRTQVLQFYLDFRKRQVALIKRTEESLLERLTDLKANVQEKGLVVNALSNERQSLEKDKSEQSELAKELRQEERSLRRQILEKQKVAERLDKAIRDIIAREMAAARRKPSTGTDGRPTHNNNSGIDRKLSENFSGNQSRLPWPVERGTITEHYGLHELEGVPGYKVDSKGIKIRVSSGAHARAIFGGEVSRLVKIPNAGIAVIIRHGDYFTVYSNLESVDVHVGDRVETREKIGMVGKNPLNSSYEIGLQIWKGKEILDPEKWIARR